MEINEIIEQFNGKKVLIIGDIILDHYLIGDVSRINPEAPVPIIDLKSEKYTLGGAANVAANVATLSGKPTLLGFIGQDKEGTKTISLTKEKGINFIPTYTEHGTTEKTRITSQDQQLIRIDKENKSPKLFDENILKNEMETTDIIIISDYAKGAITSSLMNILSKTNKKILIDPKPQNKELYIKNYIITPNEKEAHEMTNCTNIDEACEKLKQKSENVIVTRGKKGMLISNHTAKEIPTFAKEVYDVSGAGDTVIATIALCIATGATIEQAAIIANHTAGISVSKLGTSTVSLSELKQKFKEENC